MEKRNLVVSILLSLVTLGIYWMYWGVKMTDESHIAAGRQTTAAGLPALLYSIITCGIYKLYWYYKMGQTVTMAREARGLSANNDTSILYLKLALFGFGIVADVILQNELNSFIEFDAANTQEAVSANLPVSHHDETKP